MEQAIIPAITDAVLSLACGSRCGQTSQSRRWASCSHSEGSSSSGKLTVENLCLLLNQLWMKLQDLGRLRRHEEILRHPIATDVLHAIWSRDDMWRTFAWDVQDVQHVLCLYALVEGKEDYVAACRAQRCLTSRRPTESTPRSPTCGQVSSSEQW